MSCRPGSGEYLISPGYFFTLPKEWSKEQLSRGGLGICVASLRPRCDPAQNPLVLSCCKKKKSLPRQETLGKENKDLPSKKLLKFQEL